MTRWVFSLLFWALCVSSAAAQDFAGIVYRATFGHALPGYERLAGQTAMLADAAATCDDDKIRAAYHSAFDAWMGVSHLAFGPAEAEGRMFALAFWPDKKDFAAKALRRMIEAEDPVVDDPAAFAERSVAARGFFALDRLLFGDDLPAPPDYRCRLTRAIARDLAATAMAIGDEWTGYAAALGAAGRPGSPFPDQETAARAYYGALLGALEVTEELRLARPLGDIRAPKPRRAEAWRSGRPLRNVRLALDAARHLFFVAFAPALRDANGELAALRYAIEQAGEAPAPLTDAVGDPGKRIRIDALRGAVAAAREAIEEGVDSELGLTPGFNARDGD